MFLPDEVVDVPDVLCALPSPDLRAVFGIVVLLDIGNEMVPVNLDETLA